MSDSNEARSDAPGRKQIVGTATTAGTRTRATATFEITLWEETPYDAPADGAKLSRATVRKTFRGDVEGESRAELVMCQAADGTGLAYTAIERFVGRVGGRVGSFVVQHGATPQGDGSRALGGVVAGAGTGELANLRGEVAYRHDDEGVTFTLDYEFA